MLLCGIFQQTNFFLRKQPSWVNLNVKLPLCTNFGGNLCIILQVITFAANYAILQHFAVNSSFYEKATLLSQSGMSNYPCVPVLEVINALSYKLLHLLQIMLFCSILQQIDNFLRKQPSWINLECQITPVYQVWWLQMNNFPKSSIFGLFQLHIWKNCCRSSSSCRSNKKILTPWSWSSY